MLRVLTAWLDLTSKLDVLGASVKLSPSDVAQLELNAGILQALTTDNYGHTRPASGVERRAILFHKKDYVQELLRQETTRLIEAKNR